MTLVLMCKKTDRADSLTPEQRHYCMSRVKGKNTKPEIIVRSILHSLGFRFRLHQSDIPGSPDIVLRKYNSIVLVHGCFWHQHPSCPHSKRPSTNTAFWNKKLDSNIARDLRNQQLLRELGWNVVVVWECEIRNTDLLIDKLTKTIRSNNMQLP